MWAAPAGDERAQLEKQFSVGPLSGWNFKRNSSLLDQGLPRGGYSSIILGAPRV